MPGTLVGTIDWKSSLDPEKDGNNLCEVVKNAYSTPYAGLTVFFLAEAHRDPFDVERSQIVLNEFAQPKYADKLCLVAERGLLKGVDVSHLVREPLSELTSTEARRNSIVLGQVDYYREQKPSVKVLVFFYGEEHLKPIKEVLIQDEPSGTNIRWITSLSFDTTFKGLQPNQRTLFNTNTMKPAGYAVGYPKEINCLRLLTKGYWVKRFMVTLYNESGLKTAGSKNSVFAIYFKDPNTHNEVKTSIDKETFGEDYCFETFDGGNIAIAKQIR
jgi:hypothetical protein